MTKDKLVELQNEYSKIKFYPEDSFFAPYDENSKIAVLAFTREPQIDLGAEFFRYLAQIFKNDCDFGFIDENINDDNIKYISSGISEAEILIFSFFLEYKEYSNASLCQKFNETIKKLSKEKKTIFVFFNRQNPPDNIKATLSICSPNLSSASVAAVSLFLVGRNPTFNL